MWQQCSISILTFIDLIIELLYFYIATVIREEVGLSLDKADKEVLGTAARVVLTKDTTTIVGDGSTQEEVTKRVSQIRNLIEVRLKLYTNYFLSI